MTTATMDPPFPKKQVKIQREAPTPANPVKLTRIELKFWNVFWQTLKGAVAAAPALGIASVIAYLIFRLFRFAIFGA